MKHLYWVHNWGKKGHHLITFTIHESYCLHNVLKSISLWVESWLHVSDWLLSPLIRLFLQFKERKSCLLLGFATENVQLLETRLLSVVISVCSVLVRRKLAALLESPASVKSLLQPAVVALTTLLTLLTFITTWSRLKEAGQIKGESIHLLFTAHPMQGGGAAGADPSGWRWGYTLDKPPVHRRADIQRQMTIHTLIHTCGHFFYPYCEWPLMAHLQYLPGPSGGRGPHFCSQNLDRCTNTISCPPKIT